jgi:hypothetical protein
VHDLEELVTQQLQSFNGRPIEINNGLLIAV